MLKFFLDKGGVELDAERVNAAWRRKAGVSEFVHFCPNAVLTKRSRGTRIIHEGGELLDTEPKGRAPPRDERFGRIRQE